MRIKLYKNSESNVFPDTLWTLQLIFLVLKLCDLIDWPWLCVLIPLWVGIGTLILFVLVTLGVRIWDNVRN